MGIFPLCSMSTASRWPGSGESPWSRRVRGRGFTWTRSDCLWDISRRDFGACEFQSGVAEKSLAGHNCSRAWSWEIWSRSLAWVLPFAKERLQRWRNKRYLIGVWKPRVEMTDLRNNFERRGLDCKTPLFKIFDSTWNKTICSIFFPILASFTGWIWSQAPASNAHMGCCCISLL